MAPWQTLAQWLTRGPAVLVRVAQVEGSGPREVGAWMAVTASGLLGTIGGGQLEHEAMAEARAGLAAGHVLQARRRFALGPSLGQCCGGVVHLDFEWLDAAHIAGLRERLGGEAHWSPVALFGGGHVGRALVEVLSRLPLRIHWVDSREEIFPTGLDERVSTEHSEPVQGSVPGLASGSRVLIMSFSHAEDLDILAACLRRQRERGDLPFIGLIGSRSKWAKFQARLRERGFSEAELAAVHCPIGLPGIAGKQPEVIAIAVAAQLLSQSGS
ncbi:xanthine dehydrogenase accessory protein XdhC [Roseateles sp. DB2]|uniref:xanthine dehydrogenase accessory protein XdhC n=1 Tax=Roseateles sp. DB2 TaxID=3453717 RepID=UPI003EEF481C